MGAVVFCLLFSISLRYAIIHIHAQWKIISGLVSVTFDYWLKRRRRANETDLYSQSTRGKVTFYLQWSF